MSTPEEPVLPTSAETVSKAVSEEDEVYVNLPPGKPLDDDGASDLLRADAAPIVVLAGAAKCGKTTLLASLHDSFQRRSFAGYMAAGSRTLLGFEERCFDSRVASGAQEPATQRTIPADGLLFYHMQLRNENLESRIKHVLFADMSGEHYSGALDSGAEMRALTIIRRADHFVHLLDGRKLVSKDLGALTQSNAMMLMRRCFEEHMFESDAKIDILITKWDVALAHCGQDKADGILNVQREAFGKHFGSRVGRLRVTTVAARPHYRSTLPPAYGLDKLLRSWVDEPPRKLTPQNRLIPISALDTGFDNFALRETPELFERSKDA